MTADPRKTIAFASDHAGVDLKATLKAEAEKLGYAVIDLGTQGHDSVDYPDFGKALAAAVTSGRAFRGVAICGTGIGISIAANRNRSARAALCHDGLTARLAREHNDANILALGARVIGSETAIDCLRQFLTTEFGGGRHAGRVAKLSA